MLRGVGGWRLGRRLGRWVAGLCQRPPMWRRRFRWSQQTYRCEMRSWQGRPWQGSGEAIMAGQPLQPASSASVQGASPSTLGGGAS